MKNRIIEILEIGFPKSIIQREGEPISELILTEQLANEINKQIIINKINLKLKIKTMDENLAKLIENQQDEILALEQELAEKAEIIKKLVEIINNQEELINKKS